MARFPFRRCPRCRCHVHRADRDHVCAPRRRPLHGLRGGVVLGALFGLASLTTGCGPAVADPESPCAQNEADDTTDSDSDGDGIADADDACPDVPETINGVEDEDGCAEADSDGDGVVDVVDACPDTRGDAPDGCPGAVALYGAPPEEAFLDSDGDGVEDVADLCPDTPEDFNGVDDADGCPDADRELTDSDSDGVPDVEDACPDSWGDGPDGCEAVMTLYGVPPDQP